MTEERPAERIPVARGGVRLDRLVADALGCGRRGARQLVRGGRVLVDGRRLPAAARPASGAVITVSRTERPPAAPGGIRVLWQDHGLIALAKSAGIHSHAGKGAGSAAELLAACYPRTLAAGADPKESGLAHRLDRDTSGILLAATEPGLYRSLRAAFGGGRVLKLYLALVEGPVTHLRVIDTPLARRRTRVVPARRADRPLRAATCLEPLETHARWSLILASMRTGVTHQVRAHLALAGHPIIGDTKYGGPPAPPATRSGQLLHATRIVLPDGPDLTAAVPVDFSAAYAKLKRENATREGREPTSCAPGVPG